MIKLKDLIQPRLLNEAKKLRVFDFDDTLAITSSYIYVTDAGGKERRLTPGEFAIYVAKPGEKFDFRDFYSVKDAIELKRITKILRRVVDKGGDRAVYILTARPQLADKEIQRYLKDIGINKKISVIGLQSSDPKSKSDWVEKKIDNEGYDDIYFADDSIKNVEQMKKMLRNKDVVWRVQHIKH